jgi:hypothetical protein
MPHHLAASPPGAPTLLCPPRRETPASPHRRSPTPPHPTPTQPNPPQPTPTHPHSRRIPQSEVVSGENRRFGDRIRGCRAWGKWAHLRAGHPTPHREPPAEAHLLDTPTGIGRWYGSGRLHARKPTVKFVLGPRARIVARSGGGRFCAALPGRVWRFCIARQRSCQNASRPMYIDRNVLKCPGVDISMAFFGGGE